MANPVSHVGAADLLRDIQTRPADFQTVPVMAKTDCADCMWRYWCAGGCPSLPCRVTGRVDVNSPYCEVYGAVYPDVLRLEGLRLLKWGSANLAPS